MSKKWVNGRKIKKLPTVKLGAILNSLRNIMLVTLKGGRLTSTKLAYEYRRKDKIP